MNNPYIIVLVAPLIFFLGLVYFSVSADGINLWGRGVVVALLGYISARYVGRAPILIWERDFTPEARNIVGFAIVLIGFAFNIAYGWVYIVMSRPTWLASQYWGVSSILLIGVGLAIVASSIPRFPPFGDGRNGLGEMASLFVVICSALTMFVFSHLPQLWTALKGLFAGLLSAV